MELAKTCVLLKWKKTSTCQNAYVTNKYIDVKQMYYLVFKIACYLNTKKCHTIKVAYLVLIHKQIQIYLNWYEL